MKKEWPEAFGVSDWVWKAPIKEMRKQEGRLQVK